jgi:hypothetical protein
MEEQTYSVNLLLVHSKTSFKLHKLRGQEKDYLGTVNCTGSIGSAFDTRAVCVGFVVDKVTLGQVCPCESNFLPTFIIPPNLSTHPFIYDACYIF